MPDSQQQREGKGKKSKAEKYLFSQEECDRRQEGCDCVTQRQSK